MVALLEEFPQVRVDLQPGAVAPRAARGVRRGPGARPVSRTRSEAGRRPRRQTSGAFIVQNFFHAQRQRMIDPYPRYAELLAQARPPLGPPPTWTPRRSDSQPTICATCRSGRSWPGSTRSTSTGDERVQALVEKGRDFSEDDKPLLRTVELELLNAVIPEYRRRAERGPDRDLDVAVLPPDSAAAVRYRRSTSARIPNSRDAAPPLHASGGRARTARASGRVSRAAVRPPAGRPVAVGRVRVRRDGPAGRGGRVRLDGDRRADPGAHAGHRLQPRRRRSRRPAGATLHAVSPARRATPVSPARSATTRCRI